MSQVVRDVYFPYHYKLLRFFGLGAFRDSKLKKYNNFYNPFYVIYSCLSLGFWVIIFTVTLWMQVPRIYNNLDRLMLNLSFSVTFTLSLVKIFIILNRSACIQEIVHSLEREMCTFTQNSRIHTKTVRVCKQLTGSIIIFANMTVVGLVIGGILQAILIPVHDIKDRVLPMPVYLPFEVDSDFKYVLAFIYQIVGVQWYGNLVVVINTFMNTVMIHIAGRFANLRFVLENIKKIALLSLMTKPERSETDQILNDLNIDILDSHDGDVMFDKIQADVILNFSQKDIDRRVFQCLRECFVHHISIIECVEKFENMYNIGFLTHVINNLNIICHVMIQIFENEVFSIRFGTAIALFFTVVCELLVQCYAGNELSLQASKVSESIYNCQWYSFDKKYKNLLLILMARSQKPLNVTVGKFAAVSNATFVAIMRGAYSLFTVIRSTRKD